MDPESQPADGAGGKANPPLRASSLRIGQLIQEKWPEYVIEVFVILFSLTLTFTLDEWKDQARKRENEQHYLKGLAEDLRADQNKLGEVLAETRQILQRIDTVSALTDPVGNRDLFSRNLINDIRFMMKRPRYLAEDVTFADLKSTGNMQLLTSTALKRALFDYYQHCESIQLIEAAELDATNTVIGPYLLNRVPLFSKKPSTTDAAYLLSDVGFKNVLGIRRSNRAELSQNYEAVQREGRMILNLLKEQIR